MLKDKLSHCRAANIAVAYKQYFYHPFVFAIFLDFNRVCGIFASDVSSQKSAFFGIFLTSNGVKMV
jgi:hypothetical protein